MRVGFGWRRIGFAIDSVYFKTPLFVDLPSWERGGIRCGSKSSFENHFLYVIAFMGLVSSIAERLSAPLLSQLEPQMDTKLRFVYIAHNLSPFPLPLDRI